jgi:hypothetical protein
MEAVELEPQQSSAAGWPSAPSIPAEAYESPAKDEAAPPGPSVPTAAEKPATSPMMD